jgi:hypothetical protein
MYELRISHVFLFYRFNKKRVIFYLPQQLNDIKIKNLQQNIHIKKKNASQKKNQKNK